MSPGTRLYFWVVSLGGLAVLVWALLRNGLSVPDPLVFAFFCVLSFLAQLYEVELTPNHFLSGNIAINVAVLLALGGPLALGMAALSTVSAEAVLRLRGRGRGELVQAVRALVFNTGQHILAVAAGWATFELLGGHPPPWTGPGDYALAGLVFAVCYIVNLALVSGIVTLTTRLNFLYQLTYDLRHLPVQILTLGLLAILMAALYALVPWYVLLLSIPLALVYASLRGYSHLRSATRDTLERLMKSLEKRDPYTGVHSERVARLAEKIARALRLREEQIELIKTSARLHDIGKVGVPDSILLKRGELTEEEWKIMKQHPVTGWEILKDLEMYREVARIIRHEHERWDGSGYPDGLRGPLIPLESRVIAVADVWDALISDRPYRKAYSPAQARKIMQELRGTKLDPQLADVLLAVLDEEKEG